MKRKLLALWQRLGVPADYIQRALPRIQREAPRLVRIGRAADDRRLLRLSPGAAKAWRRMQQSAAADGVALLPLSAFRSVARQTLIIRRKLARGQTIAEILQVNAVPGCSEHHTGRALDLGSPEHLRLEASFERTEAFRWLKRHAREHGFRLSYPRNNLSGIDYEPWHWCWHPPRRRRNGAQSRGS